MPTPALATFQTNKRDVIRLLQIHTTLGGSLRGRRKGVHVLNKSAIVLTSAIWEAYVEDACGDALTHLVNNVPDSISVPQSLRVEASAHIKRLMDQTKRQLAPWDMAGDGWKTVLQNNLKSVQGRLYANHSFNTAKAQNVKELYSLGLGIADITAGWKWPGGSVAANCASLDRYIGLRGEIAHRAAVATPVKKSQCAAFLNLIERLVNATDSQICAWALQATGVAV